MTRRRHTSKAHKAHADRRLLVQRNDRSAAMRPAFSIIDLLVSISVIAVLISILNPALSKMTAAAQRVKCASNIKQIGLAITMYADDHDGALPGTRFADDSSAPYDPKKMQVLHTGELQNSYDGLGNLVLEGYLPTPAILYCPSHDGNHPEELYADTWAMLDNEIIGNYDMRLFSVRYLDALPQGTTLVSDGMRTRPDYNHHVGANVLSTDMSVAWFNDGAGYVASLLPENDNGHHRSKFGVQSAWLAMDGVSPEEIEGNEFDETLINGPDDETTRTVDPPSAGRQGPRPTTGPPSALPRAPRNR